MLIKKTNSFFFGARKNFLISLFSIILCALFLSGANFAQAQSCTPEPSGLVNWYRAEGNTNDIRGGESGTLNNGANYTAGKVGQAFSSNGGNGWFSAPAANSYQTLTVGFWVYLNSYSGNFPTLFERGSSGTNRIGLSITDTQGTLQILNGGNFIGSSGPGAIPLNQWAHVALTVADAGAGNRNLTVYVNGSVVISVNNTTIAPSNSGTFAVGNTGTFQSNNVNGNFDEIQVYNRALSQSEIQAIFNAGSAGICLAPTAANVSISGKVFDTYGGYISRATVTLTDSEGRTRTVQTSTFGNYQFTDVAVGASYVLTVSAKRWQFAPQIVSVADNITDLNFTAQ